MADGLEPDPDRLPAARRIRAAAEAVLLALVALPPWPFGCVQPAWELVLFGGVAVLALLWAAHAALTGRFDYRPDPVAAALLGLVLLTAFQLVPLPDAVARVLAPGVAAWHRDLQPAAPELLPGEADAAVPPSRPTAYPLTADPARTRGLLVRLAAVAVLYLVTRNLVASKASFRRMAAVGFGLGLALAVFAVGQAAGGRTTLYGSVDAGNDAFGPFVNKNHYPFAANLCAGLGVGLLLSRSRRRRNEYRPEGVGWLSSPRRVGLAAGMSLIIATVPYSLSRGGVLATLAAAAVTALVLWRGRVGAVGWGFAAVGAVAVGLTAWLGAGLVGPRLASIFTEGGKAERWAMWADALRLVPGSPVVGTGGGSYLRVEPLTRTRPEPPTLVWEHAHNDYVEALVEGGAVRLALTLGLAAAAVGIAAAGAARWRNRTVGPLLAGAVFGLTAAAAHSAVDFGAHLPAVAVLLAAVAGQAVAAARDTKEDRGQRTEGRRPESEPAGTRWAVVPGCVLLAGVAGGLVWEGWTALRVDRLALAGRAAVPPLPAGGPRDREPTPAECDAAAAAWGEAARLRPNDPALWDELSSAHLVAAAGPEGGRHLAAALAAARESRARSPLLPGPHARLGAFAGAFARGEPATVHFARAAAVSPADPTVWALGGAARFQAGDRAGAVADWRRAVELSRGRPAAVLSVVRPYLSADEIRASLLPDDPAAWAAAADALFPEKGVPGRRPFLERAAQLWTAAEPPAGDAAWATWAGVAAERGDRAAVERVWRRAAAAAPDDARFRDGLAAVLEADERYEEAAELLAWLAARGPGYADRLDAARHGVELNRRIGRR